MDYALGTGNNIKIHYGQRQNCRKHAQLPDQQFYYFGNVIHLFQVIEHIKHLGRVLLGDFAAEIKIVPVFLYQFFFRQRKLGEAF